MRAFDSFGPELFVLVDTPTADTSATKETWLMSLLIDTDGFHPHTLEKVAIGDIAELAAQDTSLWAFGRLYDSDAANYMAAIYRWDLPAKNLLPAKDASPSLNTAGKFWLPRVDFGLPTEEKAFVKVAVMLKSSVIDAEHTITLSMKVDDGTERTLHIWDASPSVSEDFQEVFLEDMTSESGQSALVPADEATGRAVQLILQMATDDGVSPEVWSVKLESSYQPEDLELHTYFVRVGDHSVTYGAEDEDTKATKISGLQTLMRTAWPIELEEDFDNDNTPRTLRGHILKGSIKREFAEETAENEEVWSFQFVEVKFT